VLGLVLDSDSHTLDEMPVVGWLERIDAMKEVEANALGDEQLGAWQDYRAVRLSDAYRAIYILGSDGSVETVYVEEVNKHDY
jgi:proteic killer suppression protein